MAAPSRSPTDSHDTLDRRHYRHHRARFPSLTEFPDSPSVYSPVYHSPDADSPSFSRLSDSTGCIAFEDETASAVHTLPSEDVQDDLDVDCTDDASYRISLQGPKIRFHSPAPWETDDVIPHGEEPDNNLKSATIGSKLRGTASRADNIMRSFTRSSFIASRPSIDSTRSHFSENSSLEIAGGNYPSSRGALYDLARESMSNSSLSSSATSASVRQQNFTPVVNHSKPSHYFTQAYGSLPRTTVSLDWMAPPSMSFESAPRFPPYSDASCVSHERSANPPKILSSQRQSRDDFVHPYANPDLVVPCTPPPETIPSLISGDMNGSDSNSTVADSTSIRSAASSDISTETSSTSLTSRDPHLLHGNPRVNGKEISSPISVLHQSDFGYVDRSTRFLSLHPPPTGFDGPCQVSARPPIVTLITLQEAQARERIRGNTVHTTVARSPFPSADDIPEATEDEAEETDTQSIQALTRARSMSAGPRHTTVTHPPAQISEVGEESVVSSSPTSTVPARAIKHKKSGFMRLFTGRNPEGDKDKSLHPPIPPLADAYPKQSLQIHGKALKPALPRVSKTCSSPTLRVPNSMLTSPNSVSPGGDGPDGKGPSSRRRQPPSLSIVTRASDHNISSVAGRSSSTSLNFTPPPSLSLSVPQSAPPGDTDFRGLTLRPVSASFSSHFKDMVSTSAEAHQHDSRTPSSPASSSTALSPFTPGFTRRSDDASATAIETPGGEYMVIQELQDQFVSAKKAWEQQIWELRGQIRVLTSELENIRAAENQDYCDACGRGKSQSRHALPSDEPMTKKAGVVNRPRALTGDSARFASGN